MIECFLETKENVLSLFCLIQIELCSSSDDFDSVSDKFLQNRLQRKRLWHAIYECDDIYVESILELCVLVI